MARLGRRALLSGVLAAAVVAGAVGVGAGASATERTGPPTPADVTPAEVEATQRALDARASEVPDSVVSWGIDPAVGLVVVGIHGARDGEVDRFLAGLDPRTYRVRPDTEPARPLPDSAPTG